MNSVLNFDQHNLDADCVKEMEKHNKYEQKHAIQHFDSVAEHYEAAYLRAGYPDPKKVQEYVSNIASKQVIPKHLAQILDFGCGTGLVGKNLKEAGFQNINGIDISQKMLEKAEEKGCYSQLVNLQLNQEEHVDSVPFDQRGKHDFVTAAGLINNNFMDLRIFEQMLICLKPGGYLVFSARFSYLGHYWYTDALAELEKAGRIKFIQDESFFKYDQLNECIGKFTKTPVKVYVYQKVENDSVFACKNKQKLSSMSAATADSDQM